MIVCLKRKSKSQNITGSFLKYNQKGVEKLLAVIWDWHINWRDSFIRFLGTVLWKVTFHIQNLLQTKFLRKLVSNNFAVYRIENLDALAIEDKILATLLHKDSFSR